MALSIQIFHESHDSCEIRIFSVDHGEEAERDSEDEEGKRRGNGRVRIKKKEEVPGLELSFVASNMIFGIWRMFA